MKVEAPLRKQNRKIWQLLPLSGKFCAKTILQYSDWPPTLKLCGEFTIVKGWQSPSDVPCLSEVKRQSAPKSVFKRAEKQRKKAIYNIKILVPLFGPLNDNAFGVLTYTKSQRFNQNYRGCAHRRRYPDKESCFFFFFKQNRKEVRRATVLGTIEFTAKRNTTFD